MPGLNVVINLYKLALLLTPSPCRQGISVDNRQHSQSASPSDRHRDNQVIVQSVKL